MALALLAVTLPDVGPNRYWLAGLLVGVGSPIAVLLNLYVKELSRNWVEAMFDLIMVITLIHLVPHLWMPALALGLMCALAPSISLHPASHWIYTAYGAVLLIGLTFAVTLHDQSGWLLPVAAVAAVYPSMLYYTHTQMRRSNELRERAQLMRGMTELAGSVAHDFNNVLTTIIGHAELARMKLPGEHDAHGDIANILRGAERASLLGRQLQSFAGRNVGRPDHVDLRAEISTMAGLLQPVMPAGVTIEITGNKPLYVLADVTQVQQVLMNVLVNAGDAMVGRDGPVSVVLGRGAGRSAGKVEVTIRDGGHGIPDRILTRIFDPLFSTKGDGHGLGLASTKKIMDDLGGSIAVHSQRSGTEVTLCWDEAVPPAPVAGNPTPPAPEPPSGNRAGSLVLVVDDDASVRSVAVEMLRALDFKVLEARNAFEAEAAFDDHVAEISAVLLDLKMPIKDGWACLRDLRGTCTETLVVICSGYDPQENLPEFAREDPHLAFLKKPYRADRLAAALSPVAD